MTLTAIEALTLLSTLATDAQTAGLVPAAGYSLTEMGVLVGLVCTSITTMVVAILAAWRTGQKVEQGNAKIDEVKGQMGEIHSSVNGAKSAMDLITQDLRAQIKTGDVALTTAAEAAAIALQTLREQAARDQAAADERISILTHQLTERVPNHAPVPEPLAVENLVAIIPESTAPVVEAPAAARQRPPRVRRKS